MNRVPATARSSTQLGWSTRLGPATRNWWPWIRLVGGASVLAVVLWRLGAGPFLDGLRAIDGTDLALAAGIGLLTTACSAWRWSMVARRLGVGLPMPAAVAACYRSQFLNTTLPGGVIGDLHRGVRHGRDVHNVGRGLRAVGWERAAGTAVFIVAAVVVLLVLPSPVQSWIPTGGVVTGGVVVVALAVVRTRAYGGTGRWAGVLAAAFDDVRQGLLPRSVWPKILLASCVVAVGHTATFIIAARAAGSAASPIQLLPVTMLVMVAMVVPLNIGGWGPREGMAAWSFGAAGFGAAQGVAAATLYGVMALAATLPGAAVLIWGFVHRPSARGTATGDRRARDGRAPTPDSVSAANASAANASAANASAANPSAANPSAANASAANPSAANPSAAVASKEAAHG